MNSSSSEYSLIVLVEKKEYVLESRVQNLQKREGAEGSQVKVCQTGIITDVELL